MRLLLVIGTYRGRRYVDTALESIRHLVFGYDRIVFVDDSGDDETASYLSRYGDVISTGRTGYNAAMKAVCARARGEGPFCFWEEDFTATEVIDLAAIAKTLAERPYLAQIALLRQPWFPVERESGGLIEALQARGETVALVDGVLEQTATFTCNPSVWAAGVAERGWPDGDWSEDAKRDQLLAEGYSFGFVPGQRVNHFGRRTGFGY